MDSEGRLLPPPPPPRLPPPPTPYPRRRSAISLMGAVAGPHNKKDGTKSVVGGIHGRRCKRFEPTNIESLPSDVLIEILVRLSTDEILEKARFVCRKWYHIIHSDALLNAHLEYSNSNSNWGLLLSDKCFRVQPLFLGVRQGGRIELSKLYHKRCDPVRVSCNGLTVSFCCLTNSVQFLNPATKKAFRSPPSMPYGQSIFSFGMAYAAASMEYKLVRTAQKFFTAPRVCHILTVGVDNNWRSVGVDHLSCGANKLLNSIPLITPGFMHWTWEWEGTRVLTFNAETEMLTESYVPVLPYPVDDEFMCSTDIQLTRSRRTKIYVSTGRRLCMFSACGDWVWEVMEMEGESGEWKKLLPNIDLEAQTRRVRQELPCDTTSGFLEPRGWVKYPVLLALFFDTTCMVYNLARDEIDYSFELPRP